ncbi:MAG: C39 family peptidase [Candidatus Peribacteria bacterium]|jgi:hypothetical protein|nr:C39 family peptidase [Candidatus Peribacteria bacterium]
MKKVLKNGLKALGVFSIVLSLASSCTQEDVISVPVEEKVIVENSGSPMTKSAPYAYKIISTVPHYYEWDTNENPEHYNWCAHAALKCVLAYHGISTTLDALHEIFRDNAVAYRNGGRCGDGKYCASLYDLEMACQYDLGLSSSSNETVSSISAFWQKLKDGVNYNKPVIVPSTYLEPYGHNYVVVGFEEGANDNTRWVYLRDVKRSTPLFSNYDRGCSLAEFYTERTGTQVFIVRP